MYFRDKRGCVRIKYGQRVRGYFTRRNGTVHAVRRPADPWTQGSLLWVVWDDGGDSWVTWSEVDPR